MTSKLFILTGTSGTGKTTVLPLLQKQLPPNYKVYDWDEILRPYDNTEEVWAMDVTKKMFQIARTNSTKNTNTVVLGLIRPAWIKKYQPTISFDHIKFCLLDISVKERSKRLKSRNAPQYLIDDLEEQKELPKWMKESGFPYFLIDTTELPIEKVANHIVNWITDD